MQTKTTTTTATAPTTAAASCFNPMTTTNNNSRIPNASLHFSEDAFGNTIQALVPFGADPAQVFLSQEPEWDSSADISAGIIVFSATIRALLRLQSRGALDAQAFTAEDYHSARVEGSYATAAEIAEALASAADLSHEVKEMWRGAVAKMRAKAQPVQAVSSTPEPAVLRLLAALETIHEAGRMSDQPRAVYCSLIAQDALNAAGNREDLETRGTKREALLAALEQCLPYVDRVRAMSGGDGDLTALTARAAIASAKGQ